MVLVHRGSVFQNIERLLAVNYFCKTLHLRYFTGFWICLCWNKLQCICCIHFSTTTQKEAENIPSECKNFSCRIIWNRGWKSQGIKSKLKIVQGWCRFSGQRQVSQYSYKFLHGKTNFANLHPSLLLNGQNSTIPSWWWLVDKLPGFCHIHLVRNDKYFY